MHRNTNIINKKIISKLKFLYFYAHINFLLKNMEALHIFISYNSIKTICLHLFQFVLHAKVLIISQIPN